MCIIEECLAVDYFRFRSDSHVYFLTHWHADHYQGIKSEWPHGHIYASEITRGIMLTKYPKLRDKSTGVPMNQWTRLQHEKGIQVMLIDSNHMAGSVMLVIKINGKYHFHTGDTRFHTKIAENNPQIFQPTQPGQYRCTVPIEQMHLDNTFCDPIFQFPPRSVALRMVADLVKAHNPTRLFVCTDSIGKEEAFVILSRHYQSKVAVNKQRMRYIKQMALDWKMIFTRDPEETWIEVIPKGERQQRVSSFPGSIAVTLTGWTNLDHPTPDGYNHFLIPYSLHSNFREIELLVSWIRPKKLIPIVKHEGKWQKFGKPSTHKSYMFSLTGIKQRGLDFLLQYYCGQQAIEVLKTDSAQKGCSREQVK